MPNAAVRGCAAIDERERARGVSSPSCSTPFLTGWIPLEDESFGGRDGDVHEHAEDAGHQDRRPRRLEVEERDGVLDGDPRASRMFRSSRSRLRRSSRGPSRLSMPRRRTAGPSAPARGGRSRARPPRRSASAPPGRERTEVRPRRVLTITGKKQRTAAVAIRGAGESGSNQALKIGENAMIGIAFAAIASGINASPSRRKRASTEADEDAERRADREAAERLLQRQPARAPERPRCVQNDETIAHGFGSRNFWMLKTSIEHLPDGDRREEDDDRRHPVDDAASGPATVVRGLRDGAHERLLGEHRAVLVGADAAQQFAHLGHELEEARVLARVVRARLRQVDVDGAGDRGRAAGSSRRRASRGRPPPRSSA